MKRKKQEAAAGIYSSNKKRNAERQQNDENTIHSIRMSIPQTTPASATSHHSLQHAPLLDNTDSMRSKLLWAKVTASKAQAENTNIAKRMGKMEELEKGMALLDKMRAVIGERSYVAKVQDVLAAFPIFSTFDACVDIIDVDAIPDGVPIPTSIAIPRRILTTSSSMDDNDVILVIEGTSNESDEGGNAIAEEGIVDEASNDDANDDDNSSYDPANPPPTIDMTFQTNEGETDFPLEEWVAKQNEERKKRDKEQEK